MNKEARPLTQEQRKEFVQLLKDAKTRVLEKLNRWGKNYIKAWDVAVSNLMETLNATKVFEQAVAAKKALKDSEKTLKNLGFEFDDDGTPVLTSDGRQRHGRELEQARDALFDAEVETARKAYEVAILNVLATESVEEAKGIVEPLV
jgi:uncharacterized membrane protein